jgi:tRNA pseudouridine55 synthase
MSRSRKAKAGLHGLLLVNKPAGITSHNVVDKVRRILGMRKVGHTGTLDPQARGLLVLCLGGATRFARYLTKQDKTYRAVIRLGESTTTDDTEGEVTFRYEGDLEKLLANLRLDSLLEEFIGIIPQVPPSFSSKKIDGVPAYAMARRGVKPELKPVTVRIDSIRLLNVQLPAVEIELDCSAGTYLRSLARDLGDKLGCGAHLASLLRTRVGDFTLAMATTLEQLKVEAGKTVEQQLILPVEKALSRFPAVKLSGAGVEKIYFGRLVDLGVEGELVGKVVLAEGPHEVRIHDSRDSFLGVGLLDHSGGSSGVLRPKRLMMEAFSFGS